MIHTTNGNAEMLCLLFTKHNHLFQTGMKNDSMIVLHRCYISIKCQCNPSVSRDIWAICM